MLTVTSVVAEALRPQRDMVIDEVAVAKSAIATSVLFVSALHVGGGGGGVPLPVNSSALGEPAPALTTFDAVAPAFSVAATVAGVASGVAPSTSAAAPATCGLAIEVPLMVLVAVSLVFHADVIWLPGAKRSVQVPKLEKEARASVLVVALTVIASGTRAGVKLQASLLELPEAIAYTTP